jgi:hypothetical protein
MKPTVCAGVAAGAVTVGAIDVLPRPTAKTTANDATAIATTAMAVANGT